MMPTTLPDNLQGKLAMNQTQAARALGVSDRTLRRWERQKLIAGRRAAGGVRLYSVEQLRQLSEGK